MSYPISPAGQGRTYLTSQATAAAAAATATLAGSASALTFITGFEITGTGATTQTCVNVTVSGIQGTAAGTAGSAVYKFQVATGGTAACQPLIVNFGDVGLPAYAAGTAISVDIPSFGSGNLHASVVAHGYRKP